MLNILIQGGPLMWPLVFLSVLSISVIYERWTAFKKAQVDTTALRQEVISLLKQNQVGRAIQLCANTPGPVSAILLVGLKKYKRMKELGKDPDTIDVQVTKAMGDYAPHVVEVLENRLNLLSLVGNVAPLLGMTGTVTGMITAFKEIAGAGQMDGALVAKGISEALITTAAGLLVAVPAVVVYNLYSRKVEVFVLEIEENATKLVDFVTTGEE